MQDVFYDDQTPSDSPRGVGYWLRMLSKWGGAALSLALVVAIIVWAYRLGVRDARDIPVIKAMDGPVRVQPDDPGGTETPHQGLEVNEILGGGEASTPDRTALAPSTQPLTPDDTPPVEVEESDTGALVEDDEPTGPVEDDVETAAVPDEPVLPGITGATRPRARPSGLRVLRAVPAAAPPAAPVAEPAEPEISGTIADPADIVPGTRLVQLGAFDSQDLALSQWRRLIGTHSDLLGQKKLLVQRADSNGRIFYRLRVVGFETSNDQRAICEALRARSVDCIPVTVR